MPCSTQPFQQEGPNDSSSCHRLYLYVNSLFSPPLQHHHHGIFPLAGSPLYAQYHHTASYYRTNRYHCTSSSRSRSSTSLKMGDERYTYINRAGKAVTANRIQVVEGAKSTPHKIDTRNPIHIPASEEKKSIPTIVVTTPLDSIAETIEPADNSELWHAETCPPVENWLGTQNLVEETPSSLKSSDSLQLGHAETRPSADDFMVDDLAPASPSKKSDLNIPICLPPVDADDLYIQDIPTPANYDAKAHHEERECRLKDVPSLYEDEREKRVGFEKDFPHPSESQLPEYGSSYRIPGTNELVSYYDGRLIFRRP
ncbi:unnamed protein product [Periconia digitata]|uniref:Uncharacterized protein n=1 Tax=Periconia digitata TaxID=1303443 RepID=A0A9W4UL20_9PLEO|nr:unnamed protein product [Periconia digitata]